VSLVTVVSCQVEVSSTGRSSITRRPNESEVSVCNLDASTITRLSPSRAVTSEGGKKLLQGNSIWHLRVPMEMII
jgi:hypothetical protein